MIHTSTLATVLEKRYNEILRDLSPDWRCQACISFYQNVRPCKQCGSTGVQAIPLADLNMRAFMNEGNSR